MKFSELTKKSMFDEQLNYYPHPQYYGVQGQGTSSKASIVQQDCGSFGRAARFKQDFDAIHDGYKNKIEPSLLFFNEVRMPKQLLIEEQKNPFAVADNDRWVGTVKKRAVTFKSTFKNVKNAIQQEYGDGLAKAIDGAVNKGNQPGPQDYHPQKTYVMRRAPQISIAPIAKLGDNHLENQRSNLQIIVENKEAKIAMLPDRENQLLEESKIFAIQQPKLGTLRKAKIVRNIYDLAKEDAFDPTHANTSIEIFLLRQRLLGAPQVPAPGTYFDDEKMSSFSTRKQQQNSIPLSSERSPLNRDNSILSNISDSELHSKDYHHLADNESLFEKKKRKYLETVCKNNTQFLTESIALTKSPNNGIAAAAVPPPVSNTSSSPQLQFFNPEQSPQQQQLHSIKPKRRALAMAATQSITTTFGKQRKPDLFGSQSNNLFPGPGSYVSNSNNAKDTTDPYKRDMYYAAVFGSGSKRFS